MSRSSKKASVWLILLLLVAVAIYFNRQWLHDWYRGIGYTPSSEMAEISDKLNLTDHGEFLFKASRPELDEKDDFNSHCVSEVSETAVLGCYTEDTIYVYNITDDELDGIRELTTAHELLHAVYARLGDDEKTSLQAALETVLSENQDILGDELDNYSSSEQAEELYVRAGTEVADLPDTLESHFAEIFKDQDAVVGYYDKYISVFNDLEAELETLKSELNTLSIEIDNQTAEYDSRLKNLNSEIDEFNSCASTAGCFSSQSVFRARRSILVAEQNALEALYAQISALIDDYNHKVEQYNADVVYGQNLNNKINSTAKPEAIE